MRTKKYLENRCDELYEEKTKLEKALRAKDQALSFLLADDNPYRVKITSYDSFGYCNPTVEFEYVDENGTYHSIKRQMQVNKLELITTSKEAAVFRYDATRPSTYWILQKAAEVFAEVPATLCPFCNEIKKEILK